jgi:predicted ABC-type ATPase
LIFLALDSPEEAIARVAQRVAQGGHFVPDELVRRRFAAGLRNFKTLYCHEVDDWFLYNNGGDEWTKIDQGGKP